MPQIQLPLPLTPEQKSLALNSLSSALKAAPQGGRNNYYLLEVPRPRRASQAPYTVECEDVIEGLQLTFDESCVFKEIWRTANARKGNGKIGHTPMYGAQKIYHYACQIILQAIWKDVNGDRNAFLERVRDLPDISKLASGG